MGLRSASQLSLMPHHLQNCAFGAVISGMKKYLVPFKAAKQGIWEFSFHGY